MEIKDLLPGEYYYSEYKHNDYSWVFIEKSKGYYIDIYNKCLTNSWNPGDGSWQKNLRLATSQEKQWLNECIKYNMFIPKDQIKKLEQYLFY